MCEGCGFVVVCAFTKHNSLISGFLVVTWETVPCNDALQTSGQLDMDLG